MTASTDTEELAKMCVNAPEGMVGAYPHCFGYIERDLSPGSLYSQATAVPSGEFDLSGTAQRPDYVEPDDVFLGPPAQTAIGSGPIPPWRKNRTASSSSAAAEATTEVGWTAWDRMHRCPVTGRAPPVPHGN